jgi:hypothetical protein
MPPNERILAVGDKSSYYWLQSPRKNFYQDLVDTPYQDDRSEVPSLQSTKLLQNKGNESSVKTLHKPLMLMKIMK